MAYAYVQNDTKPDMVFTVTRSNAVVSLVGATVKFKIKHSTGVVTNAAHQTCVLTDAVNGVCKYIFVTGDLPYSGTYTCDLEITYADASIESSPKAIVLNVRAENG